jgi:hypothetical protein
LTKFLKFSFKSVDAIAGKINQLEQQEATIIKLKQEIKDNKFLLEQKGIQEKAKESQKKELNTEVNSCVFPFVSVPCPFYRFLSSCLL